MTNNLNVQAIFDAAAPDYDRLRQQLVPDFERFYGTVLELIPYTPEEAFQLLDLGAGTGLLSAMIAARFPHAKLTLADISSQMLNQARKRFAGQPDVAFVAHDFVNEPLAGAYEIVVSALALHHTPQPDLKRVFETIFAALKPRGIFINADQTLGATPDNERRYETQWQQTILANGCTGTELGQAIERMKADRTATLEDQLRWLREAGFGAVDCWYKNYRFTVYSGQKS